MIPCPVRRMAPKARRLTRRSSPKEYVPAAAALGLASWSVMCLPSVSHRTDSTAVHPHRWAHSNQPGSSRMARICCRGVVEEADVDALSDVLGSAVGETLQPARVSLWLCEP